MTQATIALFTGDPAGIGAELVQKLLDQPALRPKASILLIGQQGAIRTTAEVQWHPWSGIDAPAFEPGIATARNGRYMLDALAEGVKLVADGSADAFCFAP